MKRITISIVIFVALLSIFVSPTLIVKQVYADVDNGVGEAPTEAARDNPRHLVEFEKIFVNVLLILWSLSILYFIFRVTMIGGQYMFSFGDSSKTAELKSQGGSIVVAMLIVFGSYIFTRLVMDILSLKAPGSCLAGGSIGEPVFQFFFPNSC